MSAFALLVVCVFDRVLRCGAYLVLICIFGQVGKESRLMILVSGFGVWLIVKMLDGWC